ncbi:hypothetical protein L917_19659 [Phytophthora nicotianae]|uniref:Uncharacterized protein n=1 Tax=Phytophthora nicotianae TaxID=4792 RepID=W2K5U9_PHYNI|nr:hypothetical protein L917_19659 [Phytophthora nicotianae]ETM30872.1 hypothetical protein L914_21453 [Phytophthora nicotianae]
MEYINTRGYYFRTGWPPHCRVFLFCFKIPGLHYMPTPMTTNPKRNENNNNKLVWQHPQASARHGC